MKKNILRILSILITTGALFISPPLVLADELTMTTYYPAPSGKYDTLEAEDATVSHDLDVNHDLTVDGTLYANNLSVNSLNIPGNLTVGGTSTLNGPLVSTKQAQFTYINPLGGTAFTVDGKSKFNKAMTVNDNVTITGDLGVTGETTFTRGPGNGSVLTIVTAPAGMTDPAALTVNAPTSTNTTVDINAPLATLALQITGKAKVSDLLTATGGAQISTAVPHAAALTITSTEKAVDITGDTHALIVTGGTTSTSLGIGTSAPATGAALNADMHMYGGTMFMHNSNISMDTNWINADGRDNSGISLSPDGRVAINTQATDAVGNPQLDVQEPPPEGEPGPFSHNTLILRVGNDTNFPAGLNATARINGALAVTSNVAAQGTIKAYNGFYLAPVSALPPPSAALYGAMVYQCTNSGPTCNLWVCIPCNGGAGCSADYAKWVSLASGVGGEAIYEPDPPSID